MDDPFSIEHRAAEYATARSLQLKHRLGFGKDGTVFSASNGRAVKVFAEAGRYRRELACYQRLAEADARMVLDHFVPQLMHWDDILSVIEMTIVERPFILDFASAYLDYPPEFSPEVLEDWQHECQDKFGSNWPHMQSIMFALEEQFGIYLLDIHPGNITFASDQPEQ